MSSTLSANVEAFARLFEAVHEGVYIGAILGAGHADARRESAPQADLRLSRPTRPRRTCGRSSADRFVDPQARDGFIERLAARRRASPIICCASAAPIARRSGSRSRPTPSRSSDGALRVEALMRDVSERKKLEDQARDLYHQLLQAEKMAALGQTISGVAHELNNPLATILTLGRAPVAAIRSTIRPGAASRPSSANPSAPRASSATC